MYDKPNERKYDYPDNSSDDSELYEEDKLEIVKEKAREAVELIKKNKKQIIIGVVAVLALFFVYDFFIGSVKEITFNVTDTEGEFLDDVKITVLDLGGQKIGDVINGEKINLRKGDYTYTASLASYKNLKKKNFTVTDNMQILEELEKNINLELYLKNPFPASLVENQLVQLEVTIKNNTQSQQEAELVFEGALDQGLMQASYQSPISLSPGENTIIVSIQVNATIEKSQIKSDYKGSIRLKGLNNTNAKKEIVFDLIEFDQSRISISGSTNFGFVEEGTSSTEKKITIRNQSGIDLENLEVLIRVNSTQFSPQDEIPQWFNFSRQIPIPTIKAGAQEEVGITVTVPVGIDFDESTTQENIQGQVVFKTTFFEITKELDLIVRKSESKIEFQNIPTSSSISFDEQNQNYPPRTIQFRLKNSGNLAIRNISLKGDCNGEEWLEFNKTFLNRINPDSTEPIIFIIEVPSSAQSGISFCTVTASYDNPRKIEPLTLEESFTFNLNLN